ncbi:Nucleotide pyrophosphohydrolase [Vibrio chagasii]|uniref:nucleotide pyrophosphohydrolase n=1 Tax=Vibrio sp. 1CM8B TaxID=2929167 RepID=UPI0020C0506B|nr:nucleotide pyrophosphohydrolase [Vibrio sp. 1CM8B]CAH7064584.1 Nucleotide pyrophosphohydrolase [Vibrio chagasii]MCK8085393.1 nucleotide pyrophosphohydrolase [Vibrio sp. 1CM8B]CAH7216365.1 Nucleotide pyrophosphohydrolase [Vibrio chagasii]CAH7440046.1 Nucleotide pyrophosphohydrolase [Vibrio chagasii]CAH7441516.1 Nucleotide pyrophosphohydrolase [Vibrio chagasii]
MSNSNSCVEHNELYTKLRSFASERDWSKFHSPKNLTMALSVEVSELMEIFQWLTEEQSNKLTDEQTTKVQEELADVFLYLLQLADATNIDLIQAAHIKIQKNAQKYPISSSYGNATKYSDK